MKTIKTDQNINGLEAAYLAVYHRPLADRIAQLAADYNHTQLENLCSELNPDNSVPCFWTLPELVAHYIKGA